MTAMGVSLPFLRAGRLSSFDVVSVYGVGRNYHSHGRELGFATDMPPVFFMKDVYGIVGDGAQIPYPPMTKLLDYEVEWVIALGQGGMHMTREQAEVAIVGFAVGIDLTRRDLQNDARKQGLPWDMAKNFVGCCPCSTLVAKDALSEQQADISLHVDGTCVQQAAVADRIWDSCRLIEALSSFVQLRAGTLIYSGTPEGVGALAVGSHIQAASSCHDALRLAVDIVPAS